jgi:ADP-ribosylglycohydrolase
MGSAFAAQVQAAVWGFIVGDALGVPVEFRSRESLDADPVLGLRGHGTYDQPLGTWSDDSSLTLATMDALSRSGLDYQAISLAFQDWLFSAAYTPHGVVFDVGMTTSRALEAARAGQGWDSSGCSRENDNGNGSLMRSLPIALWTLSLSASERAAAASSASGITHAHGRSRSCCVLYNEIIRRLVLGDGLLTALDQAVQTTKAQADSIGYEAPFSCFNARGLTELPRASTRSTGYVIDTLHAALWCTATSKSYSTAVLKAVNLGSDTDTVAAVTGSIAGLVFNDVPEDWIGSIVGRQQIGEAISHFAAACPRPT